MRSREALECLRPCVADLVCLHDLAVLDDGKVQVACEYLSHCVGDGIEPERLVRNDRQQHGIFINQSLTKVVNCRLVEEIEREIKSGFRIAAFA